jgi:hypothetical protein
MVYLNNICKYTLMGRNNVVDHVKRVTCNVVPVIWGSYKKPRWWFICQWVVLNQVLKIQQKSPLYYNSLHRISALNNSKTKYVPKSKHLTPNTPKINKHKRWKSKKLQNKHEQWKIGSLLIEKYPKYNILDEPLFKTKSLENMILK